MCACKQCEFISPGGAVFYMLSIYNLELDCIQANNMKDLVFLQHHSWQIDAGGSTHSLG